jgi:hypothetical protein
MSLLNSSIHLHRSRTGHPLLMCNWRVRRTPSTMAAPGVGAVKAQVGAVRDSQWRGWQLQTEAIVPDGASISGVERSCSPLAPRAYRVQSGGVGIGVAPNDQVTIGGNRNA